MIKCDNARLLAVKALCRFDKGGYANLVLTSMMEDSKLSVRDKAFATRIFYGTIERRITIDTRLTRFLTRPISALPPEIAAILRSGVYQIVYMDSVPVSAAVNESVTLAKALGKTGLGGLVNAVLRKAGAENFEFKFKNDAERLSVEYSISPEIVKLISGAYPKQAEEIFAQSFTLPRLTARVNTLKTTTDKLIAFLAEDEITAEKAPIENAIFIDNAGDIAANKYFKEGLFHIQGIASQLAVMALAVKEGDRVADVCAAPGGKTVTIAQELRGTGSVTACEIHQSRLSLIKGAVKRIGADNVTIIQNDARKLCVELEGVDKILCDVPCTGFGTLAKKPDIRYKKLDDIKELLKTQKSILQTAADQIVKGGRIVYSTCTINPAENEFIITSFLARNSDFKLVEIESAIKPTINNGGMCTFLPLSNEIDGFFIATLERLC